MLPEPRLCFICLCQHGLTLLVLARCLPQTPQFILLSHDDAVTVTSNVRVRAVVDNQQFTNPNGCNVPFTWFLSGGAGTNCGIARRLLQDNHGKPAAVCTG